MERQKFSSVKWCSMMVFNSVGYYMMLLYVVVSIKHFLEMQASNCFIPNKNGNMQQFYGRKKNKENPVHSRLPDFIWAQWQNAFWGLRSYQQVILEVLVLKRKQIMVKPLRMNTFQIMGGDSPKITPGFKRICVCVPNACAHVGVCIYAKFSTKLRFEHAWKKNKKKKKQWLSGPDWVTLFEWRS